MKKLLLFTILTFVLTSCSPVAPEKKGCKLKKFSEDKLEAKCKGAEGTKRHRKGHRVGFDKFKKHHKNLICQLKKIRDTAVKENATQTARAIDELVDKTQKRFHKKAKLSKGRGCPPDCIKSCCAAKKKSGTCPKTEAKKTSSDN